MGGGGEAVATSSPCPARRIGNPILADEREEESHRQRGVGGGGGRSFGRWPATLEDHQMSVSANKDEKWGGGEEGGRVGRARPK